MILKCAEACLYQLDIFAYTHHLHYLQEIDHAALKHSRLFAIFSSFNFLSKYILKLDKWKKVMNEFFHLKADVTSRKYTLNMASRHGRQS